MIGAYKIKCLVPDLPEPEAVFPYLKEMHDNRWYSNFGPIVSRFEAAMADLLNTESGTTGLDVTSFSSATTALELALKAMALPKGSRVLMPALTFPATGLAAKREGLVPVLADVDINEWTLTPALARSFAAKTTINAVMPVAPFGHTIDMNGWAAFQKDTGIAVLVDAAATLGQQRVHPDIPVCFSLHATKPFGIGEGGILVTSDTDLSERAKHASNFGFIQGLAAQDGTNAKMAEYFGAMGLEQIKRFAGIKARRARLFDLYKSALDDLPSVSLQKSAEGSLPAVMEIRIDGGADTAEAALNAAAIQTRRWYLPTLEKHPPFQSCETVSNHNENLLENCRTLAPELLGLPFHNFLNEDDIKTIIHTIRAA